MSYNLLSSSRKLLKRHKKGKPSLRIHIHPGYIKVEDTQGNAISDGPVRALVDAVYSERLRADMVEALEQANVVYYEGCLIVDVHEYRGASFSTDAVDPLIADGGKTALTSHSQGAASSTITGRTYVPSAHSAGASKALRQANGPGAEGGQGSGPSIYRVALGRTSQTLWTELGLLFAGTGMTEQEAVALEGRLLTHTAPPLCLDPSFEVSLIANRMLLYTSGQERPTPKRKAADLAEPTDVQRDAQSELQQERERLRQCNPHLGAPFDASFDRFNYVMQWRSDRDNRKSHPAPVDPHSAAANLPIGAIAGGHSALGATHAAAGSSQPGAANSPALSASGTRLKPKIRKDKAAEAPKGNAAPLPKRKKTTGGSALNATAQAAAMAAMRASANGSASNIAVDSNMAAYTHGNSWPS